MTNPNSTSSNTTTNTSHIQKETIKSLTYYEIFSLSPSDNSIDFNSVHRAYRRFALLFHPDKDPSPEAREAFDRIKIAAEILTDPIRRREYDEELKNQQNINNNISLDNNNSLWQRQQRENMMEEVKLADMILRQKEAASAAKAAANQKEKEEKEAAAVQMLNELTNSLNTPFKQMESVLVHEWDIDEDLLEMKEKEVISLLNKLREYNNNNNNNNNSHTAGMKHGRNGESVRED